MFKTRKYTIVVLVAIVVVACFVLSSCDLISRLLHQHSYDDNWFSDQTYHWQECTGCYAEHNKEKHTVPASNWLVTTQPTETQPGERQGRCSVCNAIVTEEVPALGHQHAFNGEYLSDEVGHWKECACGEINAFTKHVVTQWTIDTPATETTQGQRHGACDVCHARVDETMPVVGHVHNYGNTLSYNDAYHFYLCDDCGDKAETSPHAYPTAWQSNDAKHWKQCECGYIDAEQAHVESNWIVDTPATTTATGSKHKECSVCKVVLATETINKLTSAVRTVDFYAINDFHGTVDKISGTGGYLKQQKNNDANTILMNSGDMFQGSMESNSNYGKLLTDCMVAIGFDSFTYGNHEFDWGLDKLQALSQNGSVPFLGANIYHWNASSKTWGTFASELAQKYVVKTLDNGLKVGIIGVIGEKQITSISSNLVQTIGFKDPMPIIKELADELRSQQQCDIVVVSAHASPRGLVGESDGTNDPEEPTSAYGLEDCVDAVFCAHTHKQQSFVVDGLPFIQGGSNGSHVSHMCLKVSANGKVTCEERENIAFSKSWPNVKTVNDLIDNSNAQIEDERNQRVTYLSSSLNAKIAIPRLVSRAIAEYAKNQGHDISLAMVNNARQSLSSGYVTYSDLYEAIPFDNVVYIARVKGSEIINELNYGVYFWRSSGEAIEGSKYYKIAVIDYLLFHQNDSREYNYFRSAFESDNTFKPVALTKSGDQNYNYRLITRDYLLSNTINTSDYTVDNNNTNSNVLQSAVTLKYQTNGNWNGNVAPTPTPTPMPTHAGTIDDPYDVAEALLLGADYDNGSQAPKIYVKATVSDISNIRESRFNNDIGGFYVQDENGNSIVIYYISKSSDFDKNWSSADELHVGDVLVMYVASYVYSINGQTPQLGYGYCVSINGEAT